MKIKAVEAFQVAWDTPGWGGNPSAFVRIVTDEGVSGLGEASPMAGGKASLAVVRDEIAPALLQRDPLDHAVLVDTLFHTLVKLGPEGVATVALAAIASSVNQTVRLPRWRSAAS